MTVLDADKQARAEECVDEREHEKHPEATALGLRVTGVPRS